MKETARKTTPKTNKPATSESQASLLPNASKTAGTPHRPTGTRIFAQGLEASNDTWVTSLNNNDLVIGPTGAGKTRYHVLPNLLQMNGSFIVTDTKGSLVNAVGPVLAKHGYRIRVIDFTNMKNSFGYNPFDFVRVDEETGKVNEQDIVRIANTLCPVETNDDLFWDYAAKNLIAILCGFIFEKLRPEERHLGSLNTLLAYCKPSGNAQGQHGATEAALDDFADEHPGSFTARKWGAFKSTCTADKMYGSILGIVSEKIDVFTFDAALNVFSAKDRIDFKRLGQEKTALFLTVSDTDRSLDRLVALLYTQALQELCSFADNECPGHALPVPVRLYLDDFATNCKIPDFDKTISVIRSRNIAVTVVLQSITQLDTLYGNAESMTIVNGCDHWLYLGGQDIGTANIIASKASKPIEAIIDMAVDDIWLFERGAGAKRVKRFDLKAHPLYAELPEASQPSAELADGAKIA